MKKSIILAGFAAATMFFSCTKAEIETPQNEIINFQVANYMSQTKGTEVAFPTTDTFGTYAWSNSGNGGEQHQILMNGQTIGYTGSTWQAIDASTKAAVNFYWPKGGNVDFISYYPAGKCWFSADDDADKLTAYQSISGNDNKTNLMYADKAIGCTYASSGAGVNTLFHHALAQISVSFNSAKDNDGNGVNFTVNVTSAKFANINTNGSLELNCTASNGTWVAPLVWTVDSNVEDFVMPVGIIDKDGSKVIDKVSVLPQDLENDNTLEIAYTVTTTYPNGTSVNEDLLASTKLTELGVNSWQLNKHISYAITIDPSGLNPITFKPSISDWENGGSGSITF